jgi:hypothetical protein
MNTLRFTTTRALSLAAVIAVAAPLLAAPAVALADPWDHGRGGYGEGWRDRGEHRGWGGGWGWGGEGWREHEWREHEWREHHGYGWYGGPRCTVQYRWGYDAWGNWVQYPVRSCW